MKKSFILTLFALLSTFAMAQDKLSFSSFSINPGETKTLSIELKNSISYVGFEMAVTLPEGLNYVINSKGKPDITLSGRKDDHTVTPSDITDGKVRLVASSMSNSAFSGKSGVLVNIKVKASSDIAVGTYELKLTEILFADAKATGYPLADVTQTFEIKRTYTVTYMVDGEVYRTQTVAAGDRIPSVSTPSKTGHTFSGWEGLPSTMPESDVTVTGSFTPNTYKVQYVIVYKTHEVKYGEDIPVEDVPNLEGFTFSDWDDIPATMPARDITITCVIDQASGVSYVISDTATGEHIYTIDGKYLGKKSSNTKLTPGAYVINNKKVMIK